MTRRSSCWRSSRLRLNINARACGPNLQRLALTILTPSRRLHSISPCLKTRNLVRSVPGLIPFKTRNPSATDAVDLTTAKLCPRGLVACLWSWSCMCPRMPDLSQDWVSLNGKISAPRLCELPEKKLGLANLSRPAWVAYGCCVCCQYEPTCFNTLLSNCALSVPHVTGLPVAPQQAPTM